MSTDAVGTQFANSKYFVTDAPDINLSNAKVTQRMFLAAMEKANTSLAKASEPISGISLELYDIIDLRMLSGLVGEVFASAMISVTGFMGRNPNIDGYPDLLDISAPAAKHLAETASMPTFINFPFGGLEVKNTFGIKRANRNLGCRESRLTKIQAKLVWKAHHRKTNHLIALYSDYIERVPQIVAVFYSDKLDESDWSAKQQPKDGSTMTSFCQTTDSAFQKLLHGLRIYRTQHGLETFLGIKP